MSNSLWPYGTVAHQAPQAGVLEWVAISFSRGSSQPRDWSRVSHTAGRWFTVWATREAQEPSKSGSILIFQDNGKLYHGLLTMVSQISFLGYNLQFRAFFPFKNKTNKLLDLKTIVDLHAVLRNEISYILHPLFSVTFCMSIIQYHNQKMQIQSTNFIWISPNLDLHGHMCVWACVLSSMQFNQIHVTTTKVSTEQFQYSTEHKDPSCYTFKGTVTSLPLSFTLAITDVLQLNYFVFSRMLN